jgi:hypothetical protein
VGRGKAFVLGFFWGCSVFFRFTNQIGQAVLLDRGYHAIPTATPSLFSGQTAIFKEMFCGGNLPTTNYTYPKKKALHSRIISP